MALFYFFDPPRSECDLKTLRICLKERLGGHYEDAACDEVVHFLLSVLATTTPYLKTLIRRIERQMFAERLARISLASLREHLRGYVDYLQSDALQHKLPGHVRKTVFIVIHILEAVEARSDHVFSEQHSPECHYSKLLLPFTFPRTMVANRLVELVKGKAQVYCGVWNTLLEDVFDQLLDVEFTLLSKNHLIMKAIFDSEDDRLRRIIQTCAEHLSGQSASEFQLTLHDIDEESRFFPPCMANLHQIVRKTHRLSYDSRYQYTVFLKDVGLSVEDNTAFWETEYMKDSAGSACCHDWKQKESRYKYQIKHIYGVVGDTNVKYSRTCEVFTGKLSSKMDGGCPFQHSNPAALRQCIPTQLSDITETVIDLQAQGKPNQACAVYLASQKPIPGVKSIVTPIQFYNLARSVKK